MKGRKLAAEPEALWRHVAHGLLSGDDFTIAAGELFLALLVQADSASYKDIMDTVGIAVGEMGFWNTTTGELPGDREVTWAVHETSNLSRAIGRLAPGGGWHDRSSGLTPVGRMTAMEALGHELRVRSEVLGDDRFAHTASGRHPLAGRCAETRRPSRYHSITSISWP